MFNSYYPSPFMLNVAKNKLQIFKILFMNHLAWFKEGFNAIDGHSTGFRKLSVVLAVSNKNNVVAIIKKKFYYLFHLIIIVTINRIHELIIFFC